MGRKESVNRTGLEVLQNALRVYLKELWSLCGIILRNPNPAVALRSVVAREWKVLYLLMCNDIGAAIVPFYCLGCNILLMSRLSGGGEWDLSFWLDAASVMAKLTLYSFLFLYCFNLANQYVGVEADAIDKPWRPLPSGLASRESFLARCFLSSLLYAFVSWKLGVLPWTLPWQLFIVFQFFGAEKDNKTCGLGRTMGMWAGTATMCGSAVVLATPLATPMAPSLILWAITRGGQFGNHHWIQDFRDVEGDKKIGRTTFPILLGMDFARKLMAAVLLMDPFFTHFLVLRNSLHNGSLLQLATESVAACLSCVLAYRVVKLTTPKEDRETYSTWLVTYWNNFTFLALGPGLLLF